ncbi:MAG: hypothetical protein K1X74_13845 [Pirellulales bacterium]|nr:hypothetical protein [Pirellulales bacterium]
MPRFVILRHTMPAGAERSDHVDLMFEYRGVLKTWALSSEPLNAPEQMAVALADHRLAYLDYEGPVSQGRGHVARVDAGHYELLAGTADRWTARLDGACFSGEIRLEREGPESQRWRLVFSPG